MIKPILASSLMAVMSISIALAAVPAEPFTQDSASTPVVKKVHTPATGAKKSRSAPVVTNVDNPKMLFTQPHRIYLSAQGGIGILQDQYWSQTHYASSSKEGYPMGSTVKYKVQFNGGSSIGAQMGDWRAELNGLYLRNKINEVDNTSSDNHAYLSAWAAMVNLLHDFPINARWIPYAGVGFGVINFQYSGTNGILNGCTTLGYQGIMGVAYQARPNVRLFTEYRYIGSSRMNNTINDHDDQTKMSSYYHNNLINVGVSFFFNV